MAKLQIDTVLDQYEIIHYGTPGIPLYTRKGNLFDYPGREVSCHWHGDVELTLLLNGEMNYYVNGEHVKLNKREGIFANSKVMHYGYAARSESCSFVYLLFHPFLLVPCQKVFQRYVELVLGKRRISYLCLNRQRQGGIVKRVLNIWEVKEQRASCYEVEVIGALYLLWHLVSDTTGQTAGSPEREPSADVTVLQWMVSFIRPHLQEELSFQSITNEGNVCRSKYRKILKTQLEQSPTDYLNSHRLHISADLLKYTLVTVSGIALECRFDHLSYYSRLFSRSYGCISQEYRRREIT